MESHIDSISVNGSSEGVSGRFRPFSSSKLPKMCGRSFATECRKGKSSARDLVSGADAWRTSGGLETALLSGMDCWLGYKQAALDW